MKLRVLSTVESISMLGYSRFLRSLPVLCFLLLSVVLLSSSSIALAAESLAWDDPNPSQNVGGYYLYYWQSSQATPTKLDIGLVNPYALSNLPLVAGQTYNFAVAVYDTNGSNESARSNVTSKTIPVNQAPVAQDLAVSTLEDQAVQGTLKATDAEGTSLTYQLLSTGTRGTAVLTNPTTGAFTYTPNANANGTDTFTFRASDGVANSNTATVSVTITPVNDAPVAQDLAVSTLEDQAVQGTLKATDAEGTSLTYQLLSTGTRGTAVLTNPTTGAFTYTPNANANGADTFTFRASDGVANSNTATVSVTITPVNDAPVAQNLAVSTLEDQAVQGALKATDAEGASLTYQLLSNGTRGTAVLTNTATGAFTYTPNANANGADTFTFQASDGVANSNTATVTVSITPVNDAPVAQNGTLSATAGIEASGTLSASDSDGDPLTYRIVNNGTKGIVKLLNPVTGAYTYTPTASANGTDTFTFKTNDGTVDSNLGTTTVTINSSQEVFFEVGEVDVDQTWQRVTFRQPFTTPVVVAKPLSYHSTDPATVRIRNVDATGFEVRVQEWDYLDGTHVSETVSYMVMERGRHTLGGNVQVEAGTLVLSNPTQFTAVTFQQPFGAVPVVLTAVASVNDNKAVTTRVRNVNLQKFDVKLQGQEANTTHASETLHYILWEPSEGTLVDGMVFEVGVTARVMDHNFRTIGFANPFPALPMFLADLQTTNSGNTAVLRWDNQGLSGIDVKVEEEQSKDSETTHPTEVVGYMVFARPDLAADTDGDGLSDVQETSVYGTDPLVADTDQDGLLDGAEVTYWGAAWNQDADGDGLSNLLDHDADNDGVLDGVEVQAGFDPADPASKPQERLFEVGEVDVDHTWQRVTFRQPFATPVVVAKPLSYNGTDPATVRIRNVDTNGFEVRIQDWDYLDGTHTLETVSYMVMERGRHTLGGNVQVEAGALVLSNPTQFTAVTFQQPFGAVPVVLTAVVSVNDSQAVTTRVRNVNLQKFDVQLQGQEANTTHASETLHYILWEPSEGTLADGMVFEVGTTSRVMDHSFRPIAFLELFPTLPLFLADLQTTYGTDPAGLRWKDLYLGGVNVKVEEEQSKDSEINHAKEVVGYMVFAYPDIAGN